MRWPRTVVVDDTALTLRPIEPTDRAALRSAFDRLSRASVYARFHGLPRLTSAAWRYLTEVDGRTHFAVVLVTPTREIVGVGRFIQVPASHTELAITVADAWQGRGLGKILLDALVERARELGIAELTAFALAENAAIRRLLASRGAVRAESDGALVTYRLRVEGARGLAGPSESAAE